jgi:hypothetical protein
MRNAYTATLHLAVLVALFIPSVAAAAVPLTYTNENFWTSPQDKPVSSEQDSAGNFTGLTETGKTFAQRKIVFNIAVRLQHFTIDDAGFYMSDEGIIEANNDLQALSIYLTRVGWVG